MIGVSSFFLEKHHSTDGLVLVMAPCRRLFVSLEMIFVFYVRKEINMVEEKQYKISEMTKKVQVEAHVLRYWEEELQLPIKRNNLGHRYYTEEDVERFMQIKQLKENGVQLKGIRTMLPATNYSGTNLAFESSKEDKAYRLQMLLKGIVKEAVQESNAELAEDIKGSIIKEMDYQFRLAAEEQEKQQMRYQKQQEEYFEKLDYMITDRLQMQKKKRSGILRFKEKK